jgi:hypothetical protein
MYQKIQQLFNFEDRVLQKKNINDPLKIVN